MIASANNPVNSSANTNASSSIQPKTFTSDRDPESLLGVRDRYSQLQNLIGSLSVKLTYVTNMHEKEFLSAYRVHMLNVQLELKELKLKVAKAEESLLDDGLVSKKEAECNWFKDEKNRLQHHAYNMEKDLQHMRSRLAALKEQKIFLSEQLKNVLKRSRITEAEIELMRREQSALHPSSGAYDANYVEDFPDQLIPPDVTDKYHRNHKSSKVSIEGDQHHKDPSTSSSSRSGPGNQTLAFADTSHPQTSVDSNGGGGNGSGTGNAPEPRSEVALRLSASAPLLKTNTTSKSAMSKRLPVTSSDTRATSPSPPSVSPSRSSSSPSKSRGQIKSLKRVLKTLNNQEAARSRGKLSEPPKKPFEVDALAKIKQLNEIEESRTAMEKDLEQCIRETFVKILNRRAVTVAESSKHRISGLDSSLTGKRRVLAAILTRDRPKDPGGITGMGLEHFTEYDRLSALISFVSKPEIFSQIVVDLQQRQASAKAAAMTASL